MRELTVRPVTRELVVRAVRDNYDRHPRVFRLTSGQRRRIARLTATVDRPA